MSETKPLRTIVRRGAAANGRRILRELILVNLAAMKGRARTSVVLKAVRVAAEPHVPIEWRKPHPPYHSRLDLYTAYERATLRDQGLIDAGERNYWKLTAAGWEQAGKLTRAWGDAAAAPPELPEEIAWPVKGNWLARVAGSLRDEPDFDEVLKLGQAARRATR